MAEAAGISDARRIIADFAAAGLVKSYAGVMETIDARGASTCVRGPTIPAVMWQRVIKAGVADDVWTTGTVRLDGSDLVGGEPAAVLTAITFKAESIDLVIAHHQGAPRKRQQKRSAGREPVDPHIPGPSAEDARGARTAATGRPGHDPDAIPPGALLATVKQAMAALSVSRGTIGNLVDRGLLVRTHLGRSVRIEVESIRAYAAKGG